MKILAIGITYDTDGYEDLNLPTDMVCEVESEDEIADYISDKTGWLVKGFAIAEL